MMHLFTAASQPATRFVDRTMTGRTFWFRFGPQKLFWCKGCGRRRWAKNMRVQVFYDGWRFWCKEVCGNKGTRR